MPLGNDLMADRHSHSSSFTDRLGREEWVEQSLLNTLRHTGTVIGDADQDVVLVNLFGLNLNHWGFF